MQLIIGIWQHDCPIYAAKYLANYDFNKAHSVTAKVQLPFMIDVPGALRQFV
jgi:hypothetical protein